MGVLVIHTAGFAVEYRYCKSALSSCCVAEKGNFNMSSFSRGA